MDDFEQFILLFSQSEKKLQQLKNLAFDSLDMKSSAITCIILLKNNPQGLSAHQLSKYSGYDKALISRITNELLEKDYIYRNPEDVQKKRGYRLMLTSAGWVFSKKIDKFMKQLQEGFEVNISPEELEQFYQTIQIIAKNINELDMRRLNNA